MDLRHTFAVRTLLRWHEEGADVNAMMPVLARYLGHESISETYWKTFNRKNCLILRSQLCSCQCHSSVLSDGCSDPCAAALRGPCRAWPCRRSESLRTRNAKARPIRQFIRLNVFPSGLLYGRLATKTGHRVLPRWPAVLGGAAEETRTLDPRITSAVLYQLSYSGALSRKNVYYQNPAQEATPS